MLYHAAAAQYPAVTFLLILYIYGDLTDVHKNGIILHYVGGQRKEVSADTSEG